ncbi:type IX secretion system sortase PorU [bacterium]|nr:type IX secretion system sortase PorU [bacterium]
MASSYAWSALDVVYSGSGLLEFSLSPPEPQLLETIIEGDQYYQVSMEGYNLISKPGSPILPYRVISFGIPFDSEILIEVDSVSFIEMEDIKVLPNDTVVGFSEEAILEQRSMFKSDPDIYEKPEFFPEQWYRFQTTEFRSQRLGQITIYPVRFSPSREKLTILRYISFEIRFSTSPKGGYIDEGELEAVLKNLLINYEQARNFRYQAPRQDGLKNPFGYSDQWYKLYIENDGIYQLTYTYLMNNGIDPSSIDYSTLRVFNGGGKELDASLPVLDQEFMEVPIYTVGDQDGNFDAQDYLLFWGSAADGWEMQPDGDFRYYYHFLEDQNVYWLTFNTLFPSDPLRMEIVSTAFTSDSALDKGWYLKHWEYDYVWKDNMDWYWGQFQTKTFWLNDERIREGEAAHLFSRFLGDAIEVNGTNAVFDRDIYGHTSEALQPGNNQIEIFYFTVKNLEYFQIEYQINLQAQDGILDFAYRDSLETPGFRVSGFTEPPLVFQIRDRLQVRKFENLQSEGSSYIFSDTMECARYYCLTEGQFKNPARIEPAILAGLRDTSNAGQYVILTPEVLDPSELAEFRRSYNGYSVFTATLEQVYDEFGWGLKDLTAIRNFFRYAYYYWERAPEYAVFIGDGHYDYNNVLNTPPVYFPPCGKDSRFSDDWYCRVTTSNSIPDIAPGRIPANSQTELNTMIRKIKGYENEPELGEWRIKFMLCADDEYQGNMMDNPFYERHTKDTDGLWSYIPSIAEIVPLYLIEYPRISSGYKPAARDDFIKLINQGVLMLNWLGHGNYHLLSHESLFDSNVEIPLLENANKLPLLIAASCEVGLYHYPFRQCISEEMFRKSGGGTIGSIGSTIRTNASSNRNLNYSIYHHLFMGEESLPLGWALANGKSEADDQSFSYILFGDPATRIAFPGIEVLIDSMTPAYIPAGGTVSFKGSIHKNGGFYPQFEGTALVKVFDSQYQKTYVSPDYTDTDPPREISVTYKKSGNLLFNGESVVEGGRFECEFIVPQDVYWGDSLAKILVYAYSDTEDAIGGKDSLLVSGSDSNICTTDSISPLLSIWLENENFQSGDYVSSSPKLHCTISDSSGINITGALGHALVLILDENNLNTINLSSEFKYSLNSHTNGIVEYQLSGLSPGEHSIYLKVWDNCGNSTTEIIYFQVSESELVIDQLLPYPNPFRTDTYITFNLTSPAEVEISIFTLSGRLVKKIKNITSQIGFNNIYWDGNDKDGETIANGVYLVKVLAQNSQNEVIEYTKLGKVK